MRFRQLPTLWLSQQWLLPPPRLAMHTILWQLMNIHSPPESYKRGPVSGLGSSVEIRQPKSEDVCIGLHGRARSALAAGLYYSYSVEHRRPVNRHLLWVPAQVGIDIRLSTIVDGYYADIIDDRCLHRADTSCQPVHHYTDCVGVSWALVY